MEVFTNTKWKKEIRGVDTCKLTYLFVGRKIRLRLISYKYCDEKQTYAIFKPNTTHEKTNNDERARQAK